MPQWTTLLSMTLNYQRPSQQTLLVAKRFRDGKAFGQYIPTARSRWTPNTASRNFV